MPLDTAVGMLGIEVVPLNTGFDTPSAKGGSG